MTKREQGRQAKREGKDGRRAAALVLALSDKQTDEAIAAAAGVSRRTLARWKTRPDWKEAFTARHEAFRERLRASWRRQDEEMAARMAAYQAHVSHVRRLAALRRWGRV